LPISLSVQDGGRLLPVARLTLSKVAVLKVPELWAVTNKPP